MKVYLNIKKINGKFVVKAITEDSKNGPWFVFKTIDQLLKEHHSFIEEKILSADTTKKIVNFKNLKISLKPELSKDYLYENEKLSFRGKVLNINSNLSLFVG